MNGVRYTVCTGLFFALGSLLIPQLGSAAEEGAKPEQPEALTQSASFLSGHPDLRWRTEGAKSYFDGRYEDALKQFKRAARHADKPSQAMVAEMYWRGEGVEADRAIAYAWMDLAAERHYRDLLIKRERYWADLEPTERERALVIGDAIYAEYGDAVAKPRIEAALRRARNQTTGSRTGFVGALKVMISDGAGGFLEVDGSQYYAAKYWKPEEYFRWQEQVWTDAPRGQVDVGELERAGRESRAE